MYDLYFTITELNSDPYLQKCVFLLVATDANTGLRYNGGLLIYIDFSTATDYNKVMVYSGPQQWQARSISIPRLGPSPLSLAACGLRWSSHPRLGTWPAATKHPTHLEVVQASPQITDLGRECRLSCNALDFFETSRLSSCSRTSDVVLQS